MDEGENTLKKDDMIAKLGYAGKLILAPMVRAGTLPLRLLALDYGADIVYCEELIDFKLLRSERIENEILGTVDFVHEDGTIVFRTCDKEKNSVVLQMGTADAKRALKVAKLVENDVAGIDINMGCPKDYSVKGGMGAALLKRPDNINDILSTLVKGCCKPITCKMRLLPKMEDTLDLVKVMQGTGVSAIGVHGRLREQRPRHQVNCEAIKVISNIASVPIIANGGSGQIIKNFEDIEKFRKMTGASSVMVAREAQWNPSIFRQEGKHPALKVVKDYIKYAVDYDNQFANTKYCVQQLMVGKSDEPEYMRLLKSQTLREMCAIWKMEDYFDSVNKERKEVEKVYKHRVEAVKKLKMDDGSTLYRIHLRYDKKNYNSLMTPKVALSEWCQTNKLDLPVYSMDENADRLYQATVKVDGEYFSSTCWEKNKRFTEHGAAMVCLRIKGAHDGSLDTNLEHKNVQGKDLAQKTEPEDRLQSSATGS
ncbi:tRNA-dihydrouridine(20) synthase [NAD(P)+]-like [Antedon mediterranea]|uniref:tRNA-dihydrouridine(20) synthase [NAD(P)+]-like n=1 Tax=Antedon mediterranea TaxID=105859 RepID=UPI003AF8E1DD